MALLRHLALRCRDVEASRRFYEQAVGFEFVGYRPGGVSVDLSDGTLNITLLPHGDKERPRLVEGEEYIHFARGTYHEHQRIRSRDGQRPVEVQAGLPRARRRGCRTRPVAGLRREPAGGSEQ